jgi:hypothetical protein
LIDNLHLMGDGVAKGGRGRHPLTRRPSIKAKTSKTASSNSQKTLIYRFNGVEYVVDSMYFGNVNTRAMGGHAIAGVTCSNDRYIYNGWMRHTVDPATKQNKNERAYMAPCELMKLDWWRQDANFCIDVKGCRIAELPPGNRARKCPAGLPRHHYNPGKGSRIHFAVRKDIYDSGFTYDSKLQQMASRGIVPPPGKAYNPASDSYLTITQSEYARWKEIRNERSATRATALALEVTEPQRPEPKPASSSLRPDPAVAREPSLPTPKRRPTRRTKPQQVGFFASLCGGSSF